MLDLDHLLSGRSAKVSQRTLRVAAGDEGERETTWTDEGHRTATGNFRCLLILVARLDKSGGASTAK